MTADELRTLRAYPRHFDLNGIPVCVPTSTSLPQAYSGAGNWEAFPAADRLLVHGKLVTEKRFESLCRHIDHFLDAGGPFLDAAEV
jgi:hypothetical protein